MLGWANRQDGGAMPVPTLEDKLVIAVTSRALFNLEDSNRVFDTEGVEAFRAYQVEHENERMDGGVAFPLVRKLLDLDGGQSVEVVLVSRNDPSTGLRVFNSIEGLGLPITRAVFTAGASPYKYLEPFHCQLFLSAHDDDVRAALAAGHAAAKVLPGGHFDGDNEEAEDVIRVAFDGDAVIFGDEAEREFRDGGLPRFEAHEVSNALVPLAKGPLQPFLAALSALKAQHEGKIRTCLVTSRNAPAHKRAVLTLRAWGLEMDDALFLGGLPKAPFLRVMRPHIYFDDQRGHLMDAADEVPSGHVPYGVANEDYPRPVG